MISNHYEHNLYADGATVGVEMNITPKMGTFRQTQNECLATYSGKTRNTGVFSASVARKVMNNINYAPKGSVKNLGRNFNHIGFTQKLQLYA